MVAKQLPLHFMGTVAAIGSYLGEENASPLPPGKGTILHIYLLKSVLAILLGQT